MNSEQKLTKKGDFVELRFTGKANNSIFDSNIEEDLKSIDSKAEPKETIVVIGENMLVPGLDKELEKKEIGKEYTIKISSEDAFGPRRRELVRTIPLSVFTQQKINPHPGASLLMDNHLVRIITISGARVVTDFNNPLAGKDLEYKFSIVKIIDDEKKKAEVLFEFFFKTIPEFEILNNEIIVNLPEKVDPLIKMFSEKFNTLMGKTLKLKENKKEEKEEDKNTL